MADAIFPDTTVLCSFAAVHRLDLLEGFLRGRGRWTSAIFDEAGRSSRWLPDLSALTWLGEPIEIDEPDAIRAVEHLRRDVFGGSIAQPRKHLGEAQTCYLLHEVDRWRGSWWVSDDRDALEYARFGGLTTLETIDVVRNLVADGDLSQSAAHQLLSGMADAGRALRLPSSPADLAR